MQFEFSTASRIVFGPGVVRDLGYISSSLGKHAFLVSNLPDECSERVVSLLKRSNLALSHYNIRNEPTIKLLAQGIDLAKQEKCDVIIGLGGGSAMDSAKAIAALCTNPGDVQDYLEVGGCGQTINKPPLPCIAVPTTAGTGAEVTRNAVIGVPELRVKVSLRSPFLLPRLALIDPEMTYGLPPDITASTGFDALTQLIESFVSIKSNPITDSLCIEGLTRVSRSLYNAYRLDAPLAREDMAIASLFGGLALANSGLGIVHGFASVLGGMYNIPHGVACALLLPAAMEINTQAIQKIDSKSPILSRYTKIAQILKGTPKANFMDGITWIQALWSEIFTTHLTDYGVYEHEYPIIIEKTSRASSTKSNPVMLDFEDMMKVLQRSFK